MWLRSKRGYGQTLMRNICILGHILPRLRLRRVQDPQRGIGAIAETTLGACGLHSVFSGDLLEAAAPVELLPAALISA